DQKGWIPAKLIPPSTSNLHSRTNLDLNSFLIRYNFDKRDLSLILNYLEPCNLEFTKMHRLRIPQWWFKNQSNLTTFKLKSDSITRACAIDTELGIFYYW